MCFSCGSPRSVSPRLGVSARAPFAPLQWPLLGGGGAARESTRVGVVVALKPQLTELRGPAVVVLFMPAFSFLNFALGALQAVGQSVALAAQ